MFMPYCSLDGDIEITYTPLTNTAETIVHIEIPDATYCFKTAECVLPSYKVINVEGMTHDELASFVRFYRHNAHILLQLAKEKSVVNI